MAVSQDLSDFSRIDRAGRYEESDRICYERDAATHAYEVLKRYREIHRKAPDDPEAAWRLARACCFVGDELCTTSKDKKMIFREGADAGRVALRCDPASVPARFWTAVNMALYHSTTGSLRTVVALPAIRYHLLAAARVNPSYEGGGPYRVLGTVYENIPRVLGGDIKQARFFYEKAIDAAPDDPRNYLSLATILETRFHDRKAAYMAALYGLAVVPPSPDRFESRRALETLQRFIQNLLQDEIRRVSG